MQQTGLSAVLTRFGLDVDAAQDPAETRRIVQSGTRLSISYLLMNAAATLIAGFGLLGDSDAVIIGAMLIAMLYGPILGIGLALAELDTRLLGRALRTELVGVVWVFLIGLALGWFNRDVPIGNQLLARTAPNILDLMIALVGGAAGAYATASPKVSGAVVGVAIATALCPPLTSCGILTAHGLFPLALGALLLFLTNLTAIAVAAMLVFLVMGYRADWSANSSWSARMIPIALLLLLGSYLLGTFRQVVDEASLRNHLQGVIEDGLSGHAGARVIEVRLTTENGKRAAYAVVRTPTPIFPDVVARLDDAIDRAAGRDVDLHLRAVMVQEITRVNLPRPRGEEKLFRH